MEPDQSINQPTNSTPNLPVNQPSTFKPDITVSPSSQATDNSGSNFRSPTSNMPQASQPETNNQSKDNKQLPDKDNKTPKAWYKSTLAMIGYLVILILIATAAACLTYRYGHNQGYNTAKNIYKTAVPKPFTVPSGDTLVSQCTVGMGAQYANPSDLPQQTSAGLLYGPLFNVWNNQIVGVEYMIAQSQFINFKGNYMNLNEYGLKINHMNIMYEAAGHAGFNVPHFHIVMSTISYSAEQSITCSGSSGMSSMTGM